MTGGFDFVFPGFLGGKEQFAIFGAKNNKQTNKQKPTNSNPVRLLISNSFVNPFLWDCETVVGELLMTDIQPSGNGLDMSSDKTRLVVDAGAGVVLELFWIGMIGFGIGRWSLAHWVNLTSQYHN